MRDLSSIELPQEVIDELPEGVDPTARLLDEIGQVLADKRTEAINFRTLSGIEDTWELCEEAYIGIDDMNRGEYQQGKWVKPTTMDGPLTSNQGGKTAQSDPRSSAFVRLTGRYVDAGTAKISEILLQMEDKPFSFKPDPVKVLEIGRKDYTQVTHNGVPLTRPADVPVTTGSPTPSDVPLTTSDLATERLERLKQSAQNAEDRVYGWMLQAQHHREMRKVIFDSSRLGVGVLKGPFPDIRRKVSVVRDGSGTPTVQIENQLVPTHAWRNPWNIFPDPACGENIRDGDYVFEREYFSEKQVRKLKGLPGYLDKQIDKAIALGPTGARQMGKNPNERDTQHQYEVWHYYGSIKREHLAVLNPKASADVEKTQKLAYVIATMIGDIVIRGTINPLQSGEIPYHSVPWQRRSGYWAGIGVAEQIFVPQRIVTAATRALLNNGGLSAGPQIVINQDAIEPANKDWHLTPNKVWYAKNDGVIDDVRKAFVSFDITNVGDDLMRIVEYGFKLAEESCNIPLISQGQSGATTPETLGATQLQNNNANQLLRSIGYSFDYYITEPLIRMYYEYLLLDPNVPVDEKENFTIDANGSIAMIERSIQDQTIAQMTPLATNPQFGVDPKRWFAVLAKSKRLSPKDFQYTKQEQEQIDSQPKPQAPAVEVAKIKAEIATQQMQLDAKLAQEENTLALEIERLSIQSNERIAQLQQETAQLRVKLDTDRDTVYVQSEMARAQADFQAAMETLRLKKELAIMDFGAKHNMNKEQVQAKLADTTIRLQAQKQLAAMDMEQRRLEHTTPTATDLLPPPAQAPGKAKAGQEFAQT